MAKRQDFSEQNLRKQHLKKTLLYLNRDYATEVTSITLYIKLSQRSISAKEYRHYKTNKKSAKTFCRLLSLERLKLYLDTGLEIIKQLKYEGARSLIIMFV